jgi:two-component system, chemotaxis family, chemotaxis protein CheY
MQDKMARDIIQGLAILIVDHNQQARRLTRTMLTTLGAKSVYEAGDGLDALGLLRHNPIDVMVLDRDVPLLSAAELLSYVRSPDLFPKPNLPVIMLVADARRQDAIEALRAGAHELLLKPTSPKALQDRLLSVMLNPRKLVRIGNAYVPEPRRQPEQPLVNGGRGINAPAAPISATASA